ncbi:MAG: hypothetical protein JXN64_12095 [Spirochaetes bacterium]|nr:hypothetical protein [Spirochaetota bacterium]
MDTTTRLSTELYGLKLKIPDILTKSLSYLLNIFKKIINFNVCAVLISILLCITLIIFSGCSMENVETYSSETGSLQLEITESKNNNLNEEDEESTVSSYKIDLEGPEKEIINTDTDKEGRIGIDNLNPGFWFVNINAMNRRRVTIGSKRVNVRIIKYKKVIHEVNITIGEPDPTPDPDPDPDPDPQPDPQTGIKGWELNLTNTGLGGNYNNLTAINPSSVGRLSDGVLYVTISNVTIEDKLISNQINVESASNVNFFRCLIKPCGVGSGMPAISDPNGALTLIDCEIDGSDISNSQVTYCIGYSGFGSIIRCNIHHVASGLKIGNKNSVQSVAEQNYIHDLRWISPAHMDGITIRQSNGSGGCLIKNNRAITGSAAGSTGACFIQAQTYVNNVIVEGNLWEGYGTNLALEANSGGYGNNMIARNNRFNAYTSNGEVYVSGGGGWSEWTENYINDPSAVDNKGAVVNIR